MQSSKQKRVKQLLSVLNEAEAVGNRQTVYGVVVAATQVLSFTLFLFAKL